MKANPEIKAVNGIGPSAGMSPRDYLRQRDARRAVKARARKARALAGAVWQVAQTLRREQ